ncbi:MAG TPA: hypothetical protein VF219_16070 [Vicinamibacterales bacterium]
MTSMHAELNAIDSEAAGARIVDIHQFDGEADFAAFEREYVRTLDPFIAFCKVPAEQLASVHHLESLGFRFAEMQLETMLRLSRRFELPLRGYRFHLVESADESRRAIALARTIFTHDRYSTDELLGPEIAAKRYEGYLRKSLASSDEHVYVMTNNETHEVVSFATLRRTARDEARLLIGGVGNEYKGSGLGALHDYLGFNTYYEEGIRSLHSAVSVANYPIVNLEIAGIGFRVRRSFVVLRKAYR